MFLFFCISEIAFEMDLGSQQCVDLLLNGLKVVEGISFSERKILHNIDIHDGCIIINVTKVLNAYLQIPYPSEGANTLSKVGGYIQWHAFEIVNHIGFSLPENEVNDIPTSTLTSVEHIIISDDKSSFIM